MIAVSERIFIEAINKRVLKVPKVRVFFFPSLLFT